MKVLFIIKDVEYIDPMGIMLLSALAKERGDDTYLNVLTENNLKESLKAIRPHVVAYSAKTGEHKYYLEANKVVKDVLPDAFTVIGGPHATFFPDTVLDSNFDGLCVGEGDFAWPELLDALDGKGGSVNEIQNILTKENYTRGEAVDLRPKNTELDKLPHLDRDLLYETTRLGRFPMRSFMLNRGCPYKCTYCFNHQYNLLYRRKGPIFNRMSVDRVIDELKDLKERYDTQFIKFYDDIFLYTDDEWLDEFADRFQKEVGLPFHCLMRADLLTEDILLKLKRAGLYSLSMSIESGNDYIRNTILKRNMKVETMYDAFDMCKKHGIHTFSNTIYANPGTKLEEDIESLDVNLRCGVTFGEFPVFFPYPKTELTDYAMERGDFDGDYDKLHMSYQSLSPLTCFTDEDKRKQLNLSLLSTVILQFPSLRNIAVKRLINLPLTKLYFVLYYLSKAYLIKTKIYPMRFTLTNTVRSIYESFVLERFKHTSEVFDEKR